MSTLNNPVRAAAFSAFSELDHALTKQPALTQSKLLAQELSKSPSKSALFVTWTQQGDLRGCIGTFAQLPTKEGIKKYAMIAALEDTRFSPIKASEIPKLEVAVTLLGQSEKCANPFDWQIGLHGVEAVFQDGRSATFLPEVAEEQGWTQKDTIAALAQKAGTRIVEGFELYRYKGTKEKVTYSEYEEFKKSQE